MWIATALAIAAFGAPADAGTDASLCQAPPAAPGQAVHGPILHIPSAAEICVATGPDPSQWVPVALTAPAASRGSLMSAAFGQNADCVLDADGRARCNVAGRDLDARLRRTPRRISMQWR